MRPLLQSHGTLWLLAIAVGLITSESLVSMEMEPTRQDYRSLRCFSGIGYSAKWDAGQPFLTAGDFPSKGEFMQFDAIDRKAGTARLIGNAGSADVRVIETRTGVHFLEQTPAGNLTLTTVFRDRPEGLPPSQFAFVTSRHVVIGTLIGQPDPVPSQYHGVCQVWD